MLNNDVLRNLNRKIVRIGSQPNNLLNPSVVFWIEIAHTKFTFKTLKEKLHPFICISAEQ